MNNFHRDLQYSLEVRADKYFNIFYREVFPDIKAIVFVEDKEIQKKGIDKFIYFGNGKVISIDEKRRRKAYEDILLEVYSNVERKKKGWLHNSHCDFIVYYIEPLRKAYILNTLLLRMAWKENSSKWVKAYGWKECKNETYTSLSVCVPTTVLINAIKEQMEKQYKAG